MYKVTSQKLLACGNEHLQTYISDTGHMTKMEAISLWESPFKDGILFFAKLILIPCDFIYI